MQYIHHVYVNAETYPKLQQFIRDHADKITRHGVGYLGKAYLVKSMENLREELQAEGFVFEVFQSRYAKTPPKQGLA